MKIPEKNKDKKQKTKKKPIVKSKKEHVLIVAQEIKFARLLAGNEKKTRDRALKSLKKWLTNCFQKGYVFKEDDFTRIWKGLFYAVWMSDKPLVQEELCESIASLLDVFPPEQLEAALLLARAGLQVLAAEWYGIDQHRMDKCLMLVRRYLRGSLRCLQRCGWSEHSCQMYADMLSGDNGILCPKTPLYARNATSMIMHIVDCFLEELAKVSGGDIPPSSVATLLHPFCVYMCSGSNPVLCTASRRLLTALLRQSEQGLAYRDKTRAWEQMGCPRGGPEALELVSDEDEGQESDDDEHDDNSEKPLDPRAGRVDVCLPLLPVPAARLADCLRALLAGTGARAQLRARICMERFSQLSRGEYSLRVASPPPEAPPLPSAGRAARALRDMEKKLVAASDELALRGLGRKHRKRLLAAARSGRDIVADAKRLAASANGKWQVEETQPDTTQEDTSNKENVHKKTKKRKLDNQNGVVAVKKQKIENVREKASAEKQSKKQKKQKITINKVNGVDKTKHSKQKAPVAKQKNAPAVIQTNAPAQKQKIATTKTQTIAETTKKSVKAKREPTLLVSKVKKFQKQLSPKTEKSIDTPKKVKFVLKNNSMQETMDYYKSVQQSPSIPFDSSKKPTKTNLKPSTPSPINPFFKKKLRMRH